MRNQLIRMGYTARSADDSGSALSIVEVTPPDVVLLPGAADQASGWSDLQVRLTRLGIPVLSLRDNSAPANAATPDLSDAELKLRLDSALRSRDMYKALVTENARLAAERLQDPLTGLYNRRHMMMRVEEEIKRSSRKGYPLSCLLMDIDKFDHVNDSWGHPVGDAVLRDMAHVVMRTMRATDIVARYRDDEFIALLTDTDSTGAQIAANRLRDAIVAYSFYNQASSDPIKLTGSIGVAYWQPSTKPGEGTWEPQLIGLAERALRAAKQSGTNRLVMLQAA